MTIVVEDGTGRADAESYAGISAATDYGARIGLQWPSGSTTGSQEAALRRATMWIDTSYRGRFPGLRRNRRRQALEWPRVAAYTRAPDVDPTPMFYGSDATCAPADLAGYDYLPPDAVPREIVNATIEAAFREAASPGLLFPDIERGGTVKMERAGDTATEYFQSSNPNAVFTAIDGILSSILLPERLTARASRG